MLGYNATVAIEIDANAGGTVRDIHGVADPDWQVVPRYQSLRCALARTSGKGTPELVLAPGRPRAELGWKMLIGRPVALDNRHRLVLLDPDRGGRPRYLYVVRPTEDHFFNHKCWVAGLSEWYTSKG